jgi:hypothetical protein
MTWLQALLCLVLGHQDPLVERPGDGTMFLRCQRCSRRSAGVDIGPLRARRSPPGARAAAVTRAVPPALMHVDQMHRQLLALERPAPSALN